MKRKLPTKHGRAVTALALITLAVALASRLTAAEWKVIATDLHNPRGLDFAPNGALYIAESGSGGNGPVVAGPEFPMHFGTSGSITRVFKACPRLRLTPAPRRPAPRPSRSARSVTRLSRSVSAGRLIIVTTSSRPVRPRPRAWAVCSR
jgi:hypothetical protein